MFKEHITRLMRQSECGPSHFIDDGNGLYEQHLVGFLSKTDGRQSLICDKLRKEKGECQRRY